MKVILNENQFQQLQKTTGFDKKEVALFRHLNSKKIELSTAQEILEYIKRVLNIFGIPENYSMYYYILWISNYCEDGKYENITDINKSGIDKEPDVSEHLTTLMPCRCIQNKIPFSYFGFQGVWEDSPFGNKQYVVINSMNCLYLWRGDIWYKSGGFYLPTLNNCKLADSINFNPHDMMSLYRGATVEDIYGSHAERIMNRTKPLIGKTFQNKIRGIKTIYKIDSVVRDGYKVNFEVELLPTSDIAMNDENLFKTIITKLYTKMGYQIEDVLGTISVK